MHPITVVHTTPNHPSQPDFSNKADVDKWTFIVDLRGSKNAYTSCLGGGDPGIGRECTIPGL